MKPKLYFQLYSHSLILLAIFLSCCTGFKEQKNSHYNTDFETVDSKTSIPTNWDFSMNNSEQKNYRLLLDSTTQQKGRYCISIQKVKDGSSFGAFTSNIKEGFTGHTIELKGYIKTSKVKTGFAGIWLRLDGDGKMLYFNNMKEYGVKGDTDWKLYSIRLPYTSEVRNIVYGGLLLGDGKAWYDNLEILIDGISINEKKALSLNLVDRDSGFMHNSKVILPYTNQQVIKNLATTAQLWSFLKYHHPYIAKGNCNWDAELFRILPGAIKANGPLELSKILESFVDKFPVPQSCMSCTLKPVQEAQKPDYGYLFDEKTFSKSLKEKLLKILKNRITGPNYYIDKFDNGNPNFKNEKAYANMSYPDVGYRLLSLFRYWSMINYYFPYKNDIGENWNLILEEFIPVFIDAKNEKEYILACLKLISRIHDSHAYITTPNRILESIRGKMRTPFEAKFIQDKLVITRVYQGPKNSTESFKTGDVINEINHKTVKYLCETFLPLTPGSNYYAQLRDLPNSFLLRSNDLTMSVKIIRAGKPMTSTANLISIYQKLEYPVDFKAPAYSILKENIGFINAGRYKSAKLSNMMRDFSNTKGLIIDLRFYPGDTMFQSLGAYIDTHKTNFAIWKEFNIDKPGSLVFGSPSYNRGDFNIRKGYAKPIILLVNSETQSQGEFTTMAFQVNKHVKVLGSETAGADGNVSSIVLPGGITTSISGLGVFYPDFTPTQRIGVKIDYSVKPTIDGIAQGKDELLEKAVKIILQSK